MQEAPPLKVKKIWIRMVEGVNVGNEKTLNSDEWFETSEGVPRGIWKVFKQPNELERLVKEIVQLFVLGET